ncbi:MAG TPA: hypothetical protein VKU41_23875 [Polyangiaceae bacterium]|nr:hypothetical protein [Polyangiaceae bacterium]
MEIDSVSVLDAKVTFYSAIVDGKTDIGMLETGSAFSKHMIVAPLLAQRLTTQEIYLALAAQGATAPPALVAAQADEAAAMGRSAEVRRVTVDTSQFVEKSLAWCENLILGKSAPDGSAYYWSLFSGNTYSNQCGAQYYPTSTGYGSCNQTTDWVIMGGCNEGSTTVYIGASEQYGSTCSNGYSIGTYNMAPGYYAYWYWKNTGGAWYDVGTAGTCPGANYDMLMGYEVRGGPGGG